MLLSVVMPVYNEERTLEEIVRRVQAVDLEKEIVAVDDCSRDGSHRLLLELQKRHPNLRVLRHESNRGKGAAVRTGLKAATGDVVLIQDADLEYDPREYFTLIGPILDGRADVVFGSRFLGGPHRVHLFFHYVANRFLTFVSNCFTNLNLTDMETCYKVFRRAVVDRLDLTCDRFGIEPEITAKVARMRARVYEVPISYSGRDFSEGKKISWKDGFPALWAIFKYNLTGPRPEPLPRPDKT
ncbi:MAG TPA: glycosyltransferase family 2 protein [Planctomycetota bacterium]|nr:glycosyltransferase family 2 protein [Planctomycetota bacterium]